MLQREGVEVFAPEGRGWPMGTVVHRGVFADVLAEGGRVAVFYVAGLLHGLDYSAVYRFVPSMLVPRAFGHMTRGEQFYYGVVVEDEGKGTYPPTVTLEPTAAPRRDALVDAMSVEVEVASIWVPSL